MKQLHLSKENFLKDLAAIKANSPLVHNITNYVVMNNTANALLSVGASPVMAHALEEVEQMASFASALVLNIGTLEPQWIEAMLEAGKVAKSNGVPVVLDPVGAGATTYRTDSCIKILNDITPDIIRGNASEIMALNAAFEVATLDVAQESASASESAQTKGVDSTAASSDAVSVGAQLAKKIGGVVSISGMVDYITDGESVVEVPFGSTMLTKVTGLGCTASAITGAFAAVNSNRLEAAAQAMLLMGCVGEIAAGYSKGNGSLQLNFLDELYNFDQIALEKITDGKL